MTNPGSIHVQTLAEGSGPCEICGRHDARSDTKTVELRAGALFRVTWFLCRDHRLELAKVIGEAVFGYVNSTRLLGPWKGGA